MPSACIVVTFPFCLAESAASDTPTLTLRGFTYQALGQLAKRSPQLFQKDTDIAAQFFSALSVEPPGVRAALQEAVSTLATAYKDCSGMAATHTKQTLSNHIFHNIIVNFRYSNNVYIVITDIVIINIYNCYRRCLCRIRAASISF